MPNRIIKESICTSDNIDQLSAFQETMFYRLIVTCDDYGRMDARPKILAARLFPLKDIRVTQIEDALRALTSAELVTLYTVDGKPFLQMNTWNKHQRVRDSKEKYPGIESAASRGELPQVAASCGLNPIQSNPNPNPNPNPKCTRAQVRFTPPSVDDVRAYCQERGNRVDAQRFVDFYASKGWRVGNQPMKDWRAAVRTWERDDRPVKTVSAQQYTQRDYTEEELDAATADLINEAQAMKVVSA